MTTLIILLTSRLLSVVMINWNVHHYLIRIGEQIASESVDYMGDCICSADSYETCIFQCVIPMGNLSKIRLVWS